MGDEELDPTIAGRRGSGVGASAATPPHTTDDTTNDAVTATASDPTDDMATIVRTPSSHAYHSVERSAPDTEAETAMTSLERRKAVGGVASTQAPTRVARSPRPTAAESGSNADDEAMESMLEELRRPSAQRLRMLERHAEGGMGAIELVIDEALSRRMAMKVMRPDLRKDSHCLRLFLREARVTAQLEHPNIVPVHDMGEDREGRLYFTMKLVEGQTLEEVIRSAAEFPPTGTELYNILDIVARVCDALAFAHSRGVLHCDIKPANVMVGDYGQVYLMDWGIARILPKREDPGRSIAEDVPSHRATTTRGHGPTRTVEGSDPLDLGPKRSDDRSDDVIMGTAAYMSPEQAHGRRDQLDERSDVFQMGALIYEILTGRAPFHDADHRQAIRLARQANFTPLDKALESTAAPRELIRIVGKAMEHRPDDRYPHVELLKDDLVHFVRGGGEFPRVCVASGDHIIREGEVGDTAYIITTGRVEIYRMIDGKRLSVGVLGPGEVFGETAVLTSEPRMASVVALRPTTLYVVTREVLDREVDAMKPWVGSLLRSLAHRFREVEDEARG